jgi:anti-anti-sigma regulatory factor
MNLKKEKRDNFLIIRIMDDLHYDSSLNEVRDVIEENLAGGIKNFALYFNSKTHLSSISIGYILNFFTKIKKHNGMMAIIQPNKEDTDLLKMLSTTCIIDTFESEEKFFNWQKQLKEPSVKNKLNGTL